MSYIRAESQQTSFQGKQHYDLICEATEDLTQEYQRGYLEYNGSKLRPAAGSLCYCLADKGVYVKTPSGSWEAAV